MFGFFRRHRAARVALFAIPMFLLTPLAFAGLRGGWHGCGMHPETPEQALTFARPFVGHVLDDIDATPEQRETLDVLLEESVREGFELHTQGADLRARVRDAMSAGADEATLEALRQESVALFEQGSRLATQRLGEARRVLTAEQWTQLQAMHDERMADRW